MAPQLQPERSGNQPLDERARNVIAWVIAISAIFVMTSGVGLMGLFYFRNQDILRDVATTHFRAVMGAPASAMTATVVVTLLRVTLGDLEFDAPGFKFKGASGPVVLWVFTFLACVAGIVALW